LLHAQKAEPSWTQNEGCTLLSSGVLRLLPESTWDWALKRNLVKGPWYRCPPGILNHFESQAAIHIYSRSFGKLASLPRLGITPQELEDLGLKTVPPPADASLPSLSHPSRPF